MTNQSKDPQETKAEVAKVSDVEAQKRLNHIAEEAAQRASRTEQRYDKNHGIFSK